MGLSTHVLDTMHGCPAAGMAVRLYRLDGSEAEPLASLVLDADGRAAGTRLLGPATFQVGRYRLVFAVGDYFRRRGVALPDPPFLDEVAVDFGMADVQGHYHVPLLVSPWSYATYRGS